MLDFRGAVALCRSCVPSKRDKMMIGHRRRPEDMALSLERGISFLGIIIGSLMQRSSLVKTTALAQTTVSINQREFWAAPRCSAEECSMGKEKNPDI